MSNEESFVNAVLNEPVSSEVANLTLTVGDIIQIARWLAPVAERLTAAPPAPTGERTYKCVFDPPCADAMPDRPVPAPDKSR